jgi:hypothetical protein
MIRSIVKYISTESRHGQAQAEFLEGEINRHIEALNYKTVVKYDLINVSAPDNVHEFLLVITINDDSSFPKMKDGKSV